MVYPVLQAFKIGECKIEYLLCNFADLQCLFWIERNDFFQFLLY